MSDHIRFMFMASRNGTRDGDMGEATLGAHADFFVPRFRPIFFRHLSELDSARMSRITIRLGYHYVRSTEGEPTTENRFRSDATLRWALIGHILMSNRNRGEYRFMKHDLSFRYRNELKLEHDVGVGKIVLTPYVAAEIFYDTRYDRFSRWSYTGGVNWTLSKRLGIDTYFMRIVTKHPSLSLTNGYEIKVSYYLR